MNDKRRKKLRQAAAFLRSAGEIVAAVLDEEQDSLDNIPDGLSETDRYASMEDAIDALEKAGEHIDSAIDDLEEAAG